MTTVLAAVLVLAGCDESGAAGAAGEGGRTDAAGATATPGAPATPPGAPPGPRPDDLGFAVWHEDFPFAVHLSPEFGGRTYRRSRSEALEKVISNLKGDCTRPAWLFAKEFFARVDQRAVAPLVEAMDRALQSRNLSDTVENIAEAMGRMGHLAGPELSNALLRALHHHRSSVVAKAMTALGAVGTPEAIRAAEAMLPELPPRAHLEWFRAAVARLPEADGDALLTEHLTVQPESPLRIPAIEEVNKLPVARAARLLEPLWASARGTLQMSIATTLHGAGDLRGTVFLREMLREDDPGGARLTAAINAARVGDVAPLEEDLLRLCVHPNAQVRAGVVIAVAERPGENIDNALTTLAADPAVPVRQPALLALRERGLRSVIDDLIRQVRDASGTKLATTLADLSACGDPAALQAVLARMESAPIEEHRGYIQAIGRSGAPGSFDALRDILLAPERPIDAEGDLTSATYAGILLPNASTERGRLLKLFGSIDRADYRRRAIVLQALAVMGAAAEDDPEFRAKVFERCRGLLQDRSEPPQLRLLGLEYLRRDLRLTDMEVIKRMQDQEEPPMRRAVARFLYEFF
ncbi:MAG: hypothetical protein AAF628_04390 [Planctomycetota bacterium]